MKTLLGKLKGALLRLVDRYMPDRTKRLVTLASLWARITDAEKIDDHTLRKLNAVMVLSNSDQALRAPMELSQVIWHGKNSDEVINRARLKARLESNEDLDVVAQEIEQALPSCLNYSQGNPRKDIRALLIAIRSGTVAAAQ